MTKSQQQKTKDIFISLENDFAFKHVMKNEKVLKGFLGAVMGMAPDDITDIQYMDTQLGKESVHIGVLGFDLFKTSKNFHSKVQLLDTETGEVYSDKITFYVIELSKLKHVPKEKQNSELYYWSCLINAKSKEEYEMLAKQNDYLKEAVDETEKINLDETLKYAYLMRQLELMDEASHRKSYYEDGKEEGIKEGIKEGKEEERSRLNELTKLLIQAGRMDDILRGTEEPEYQEMLLKEYGLN